MSGPGASTPWASRWGPSSWWIPTRGARRSAPCRSSMTAGSPWSGATSTSPGWRSWRSASTTRAPGLEPRSCSAGSRTSTTLRAGGGRGPGRRAAGALGRRRPARPGRRRARVALRQHVAAGGRAVRGEHLHAVEPDRAGRGGGQPRQLHGVLEQRRDSVHHRPSDRRFPWAGRQLLRRLRPALLPDRLRGGRRHPLPERNRFAVRATWKNPFSGETGVAHATRWPPTPAPSGSSIRRNLEPMIKVLDGRARQRPLLGLLRRAVERRVHADGDRHPDRSGRRPTTTPPASSPAWRTRRLSPRRRPRGASGEIAARSALQPFPPRAAAMPRPQPVSAWPATASRPRWP